MTTLYLVIGFVALGGFALWLAVKISYRRGRSEERAKAAEASHKAGKEAGKIDDDVRKMSEADLDRELRGDD